VTCWEGESIRPETETERRKAVSLTEALLLDPHPLDVWLAVRSDGLKGSGVQADPWNAGPKPYPAIPISNLIKGGADGKTATASTSANHGFATGDWVTISGVEVDPTNKPADVYYLGTFAITVTGYQSFTYQMLYAPTSSPAPGSARTCCRERELFDTLMRSLPENTTVHLGPGVFETKGLAYSIRTWQPKSGQKILGSGIDVTTLKLVGAAVPETRYCAINHFYEDFLHDVEVADFTIDCNVTGQPGRYVTCDAVGLKGRHIRIRRIRAINWGSHTQTYVESFPIVSGATYARLDQQTQQGVDCVIEDCTAERPSPNPVNNSTILLLGGGETADDGVQAYHRGCAIRNCYVNGEIIYGTLIPLPIYSISYDATAHVVTVITRAPHLLTRPGNVVVRGVTVSGNPDNLFNGVFEIASVESATTFKYELVTTATPDAGNGYVGGGVSSIPVAVQSIVPDDTLEVCPTLELHDFQIYEPRYTLTTREPHCRTRNNNLRVLGVLKPGLVYSAAFNGAFPVDDYIPSRPYEVQYTLLQQPDAKDNELGYARASVNMGHVALSADNGTGTVVEGNRVFHCATGGPFHDTWASKDLIARNNYYHDVRCGPFQNLSGISTTPYAIPLVSLDHEGTTARARTSFPHGLILHGRVTISNIAEGAAAYNGLREITAIPAPDRFEYTIEGNPAPPAQPGYSTYEAAALPSPQVVSQKRLESLFYIVRDGKKIVSAKTTYAKHGFLVGEVVRITMAGHFDRTHYPNSGVFNGIFTVSAVPNEKTFEYELGDQAAGPGVDSENQDLEVLGVKGIGYCQAGEAGIDSESEEFAAGYFGKIWQTHSLVIENNVIELNIRRFNSDWGHAGGLRIYGTDQWVSGADPAKREYSIVRLVARGNVIRNVDDLPDPNSFTLGIEVGGCEQALIEHNIVSLPRATPIEHNHCGEAIQTFNNLTPAGALVKSFFQGSATEAAPEVTEKVRADLEDAIISSFLKPEED